jgi:EAL domain-containing protein (putative c-di-GMP-specific phosphodiesterase class I)
LNTDGNNLSIIETIIAMAKHIQLSVIAESVETADQKDLMEKLSYHHFQGYYFSKPLAKEDLETFLINRRQPLNLIHPSLSDSP